MPDSSDSNGWRPIETAPKDGTTIILANGERAGIGFWREFTQSGYPWRNWFFNMLNSQPYAPTHWQPLPPPPEPQR